MQAWVIVIFLIRKRLFLDLFIKKGQYCGRFFGNIVDVFGTESKIWTFDAKNERILGPF